MNTKDSSPKTMKDILLRLIDLIDGMDSEDGEIEIYRVNPKLVRIDLIMKGSNNGLILL